ncbi:MAG: M48 family metallopeptidase [Magnetococcus sp. YQC-3]
MNPYRNILSCLTLCSLLLTACQSVPLTGRSQLSLVSSSQSMATAAQNYKEFLNAHHVLQNSPDARMVQQVGDRIRQAVETYMAMHQLSDQLTGYAWQFALVDNPHSANAFCLPGGKIVVYTGMLPFTRDEEGLAAIIGHEVAHAVAQHSSERQSQRLLTTLASIAVPAPLGEVANFGMLLPYSRLHESEADRMGMHFMAMAGYNPEKAVAVWSRLKDDAEREKRAQPEFFSTHPSDDSRIAQNQATLREVWPIYQATRAKNPENPATKPP